MFNQIFKHNYINSNEVARIKDYKYSSEDYSYTYKYLLSPLADFIVDRFIPGWMA